MSFRPTQLHEARPSNSKRPDTSSYRSNATRTMLKGLIHAPLLMERSPGNYLDERQIDRDFQPPVPRSTAELLSLAEAKIKDRNKNAQGKKAKKNKYEQKLIEESNEKLDGAISSLLTNFASDPLRWLRDEQRQENPEIEATTSTKSRPSSNTHDKLITIGGYIINIEKNLPPNVHASIKPIISSSKKELEIEVRIKEVDPTKIVVEKRYNSILVIGVKETGIKEKSKAMLIKENIFKLSPTENDIIEIVNIFAPREIFLSKVLVTQPDATGRVLIKAPFA